MTNIVLKSNGKQQPFQAAKLQKSLKASCLAVGASSGESKKFAELTTAKVNRWLKTKTEITSQDIRLRSAKELAKYHPDAANFYQHYQEII